VDRQSARRSYPHRQRPDSRASRRRTAKYKGLWKSAFLDVSLNPILESIGLGASKELDNFIGYARRNILKVAGRLLAVLNPKEVCLVIWSKGSSSKDLISS
jgi:hypothetical protein